MGESPWTRTNAAILRSRSAAFISHGSGRSRTWGCIWDDIRTLIAIQRATYDLPTAYHYFCEEFENLICYIFGASDQLKSVGKDKTDEKLLLRSALLSVTHKLYLDAYLRLLREEGAVRQEKTQ